MTDRDQDLDIEITGAQQAGAAAPHKPRKKREKKVPYKGWSAAELELCTALLLLRAALGWSWARIARAITNNVGDDERLRRFGEGTQVPEAALLKRISNFIAARDPGAALRNELASLAGLEAAFVRRGHNPQHIPSALPLGGQYKAKKIDKRGGCEIPVEIGIEITAYADGGVTVFEAQARDGQIIRAWGYGCVSPEGRLHLTMRSARGFSHEYQHVLEISELCSGAPVQNLTLRRMSYGAEVFGDPEADAEEERRHFEDMRVTFVRQAPRDETK
jgi:hypothetical protein